MYPHLETYLKGIRPHKKHIYLTTNGSLLDQRMASMLCKYLDGINISVHHFSEYLNDSIYKTHVSFARLRAGISVFKNKKVPVRFNVNLVKGCLDTRRDAQTMIDFAAHMGASEVRFNELQDAEDLYVDARDIFEGLTENPFEDGCEQTIAAEPIRVKVKMTCGCVNKRKPPITRKTPPKGKTKVLYPSAEVTPGWVAPKTAGSHRKAVASMGGCHIKVSMDGCHPVSRTVPSMVGCHGWTTTSSGCHGVRR